MKTTAEVIKTSGIDPKLVRAVIRQTGLENLADIAAHGIDGGFSGFVYYSETVPFFKRNKAEIVRLVESMADSLGEKPIDMVAAFGCLKGDDWTPSIARCLYGGRVTDDDTTVANALAWFAGEEVARAFED
jgi:hypothetical protein